MPLLQTPSEFDAPLFLQQDNLFRSTPGFERSAWHQGPPLHAAEQLVPEQLHRESRDQLRNGLRNENTSPGFDAVSSLVAFVCNIIQEASLGFGFPGCHRNIVVSLAR